MAKREQLRQLRKGTVINVSSNKMESELIQALVVTTEHIRNKFGVVLDHQKKIMLKEIAESLRAAYPDVVFEHFFDNTSLLPDGGVLSIVDSEGQTYPILISEAKRQGTNDAREKEGLKKQAKGNAIERLGKNLIGFRTWLSTENILPFVVFGQGVDFAPDSSILDRVSTLAMFAPLNQIEVHNQGQHGRFNRGSFFFRVESWRAEEMIPILNDIAERSVFYYFAKYGESKFVGKTVE